MKVASSLLFINSCKKIVTPKNIPKNKMKFTIFDFIYPTLKNMGKYIPVTKIKANNTPIISSMDTGYTLRGSSNTFMMPESKI